MRKALMWLPLLMIGIGAPALAAVPEAWKHTAYAYDARHRWHVQADANHQQRQPH
jgi:hypothetical protein